MRFRRARKLLKYLARAVAVCSGLFLLAVVGFAIHCSTIRGNFQPSPASALGRGIPGYSRPEDDTFLTYAEWYIVWSYQEKARWQQANLPSGFPYLGAIGQYWGGYCCSYGVVRGRYPFNFGDHLMLSVIGTSFTVEYGLKGLYENTVGRLTEWSAGHRSTDADHYAAQVARDYGLFVQDRPFYEFPFFPALQKLWANTTLSGPDRLRKWERRAWLTLDYAVEGVYCGLIEVSSHAVYGVEEDVTYAVVGNSSTIRMPRYQKFTDRAMQLLRAGTQFTEIAGNRQIMVTALVPRSRTFALPAGELLFAQDILTDKDIKRVAIRVPVAELAAITGALPVEHIYDY